MHLPGRDRHRPNGAVIVVPHFAHSGCKPPHANAVAAHDRVLQLAVPVEILHPHGAGVFIAELEDVAHLDAAADAQVGLAAGRPDATREGLRHVKKCRLLRKVALQAYTGEVVAILICAAYGALDALHRAVKNNLDLIVQADRADGAGHKPAILRDLRGGMDFRLQQVAQLGFIHFQIAPDKDDHIAVILIFLVNHGLAGLFRLHAEEGAEVFNGFHARGGNLF